MTNYGLLSLIPVAVVIITALITRRSYEPLLLGGIVGFIIADKLDFFGKSIDGMYVVLSNPTVQWLSMMMILFGALIKLFEKSGSTNGLTDTALKISKSKKSSLLATWILGIIVFADDYLNALAVGVTMRNITDSHKTSREYLAFIVACTGASVCCLIPVASWAAFMMGLMVDTGFFAQSTIMSSYMHLMPYLVYCWITVFMIPFMILKLLPLPKWLKAPELRAEEEGICLPNSEYKELNNNDMAADLKKSNPLNFIIPIFILAVIAVVTGDILIGVIIATALTIFLIAIQKLMKPSEICDSCLEGAMDMIGPLLVIIFSFFLQEANTALGLTEFVINSVAPIMIPAILPAVTFAIIALLAFGTSSFWGTAAISFPIILPLADAIGSDLLLASAAVICGTVVGCQTCFFSDCATLVCVSTEIKNETYGRTVSPSFIIPTILSCIIFVVLGFVIN